MKICISTHRFPPEIGGNELYSNRLATELYKRGHNVTVYTTAVDKSRETPFAIREFQNVVPEGFGYFAWPGVFHPKILRELRSFDAVHAVNASMFSAVVGAIAKQLSRSTQTILTTTYHPPRVQTHQRLKRFYDQIILQRVLEQYDRLIVSSDYEMDELKQSFNISDFQISRFDIPPITESEITGINPNEDVVSGLFTILYVGRLDSQKGVVKLLQAVERLKSDDDSIRCVVIGERERWYEWPDEVADLVARNEDVFDFKGFVPEEELAKIYSTSNVLALPSRYETFGQVVVEALTYGTPVVMTPVGIGPERIENGQNGVIYDPDDPDALVNALDHIKNGNTEQYRQNAKESVADLSWDRLIDHLEDIYQ